MNSIYALAFAAYQTYGRETAKRMLTPPRAFIEKACAKTGADVAKAIEERDEAVEETLELLESMVDKDFVDPEGN